MPSALVEALLEVAPVFANLTPQEREELLKVAAEETYAAGFQIVSRGSMARSLFVLAEGTVEVLEADGSDGSASLATLIPPCAFGEVTFFGGSPPVVTVRALTDVRLLVIERTGFDQLLGRQSLAAYKLAHNVVMKLGDHMRRIEVWMSEQFSAATPDKRHKWLTFRAKLYEASEI